MAMAEDAASVLEQFVQDVANLPAEIAHLLEEVQAKEVQMQELQKTINKIDSAIQKYYKTNGPQNPHPKEEAYCKQASECFEKQEALQDEKVILSEKAAALLDRHVKRLDKNIRDLHNDGTVSFDPPLPSLLNPGSNSRGTISAATTGTSTPLHPLHPNAAPPSTTIANNPSLRIPHQLAQANRPIINSPLSHPLIPANLVSSLPTPPSGAQNGAAAGRRDSSAGLSDTNKKRKLGSTQQAAGTPSALKQSTLTALAGASTKPSSGSVSRGSSVGPRTVKKTPSTVTKKLAPHQAAAAARKAAKSGSQPKSLHKKTLKKQHGANGRQSKRSGSAGTHSVSATSGSDASGSESEADSTGRASGQSEANGGSGGGAAQKRKGEEMDDAGDGEGDDRKYCVCQTVSHGDMVACDNDECEFEWFHWECVGLKSEPAGTWYCEACKAKRGGDA